MTCKQMESCIQQFIEHKLPDSKFGEFYEHLQHCDNCMDDLMVNYAIYTAIAQLNRGEEFSDDYNEEVLSKLTAQKNRLSTKRRNHYFRKFVVLCIFLGAGFAIGLTNSKNMLPTRLPDNEISSYRLKYYGIEKEDDPVYKAIQTYNDEVIRMLHEVEDEKEKEDEVEHE